MRRRQGVFAAAFVCAAGLFAFAHEPVAAQSPALPLLGAQRALAFVHAAERGVR